MKKTKAGFIMLPALLDNQHGNVIAEFETDRQYPIHFGELYIIGDWFDIDKARRLRDFLNEVLPP